MQLYFLTAVGWSLDANGNLQALDTAGNKLAVFQGGFFSMKLNWTQTGSQLSDASTNSATDVSTGIGANLTIRVSGRVLLLFMGTLANNTGGDGAVATVYYNTVGVPAAGTSVGSDASAGIISITTGTTLVTVEGSNNLTGLTVGTKYYFYIGLRAVTGGTALLKGITAAPPTAINLIALEV